MYYGTLVRPKGGDSIISYHKPVNYDNLVFSIDNIVLDFEILRPVIREQIPMLLDQLAQKHGAKLIGWSSYKPGTFREQTSVKLEDGTSFWIGVALNGVTTAWKRCRMEFNPNKVGSNIVFCKFLKYLVDNTSHLLRKVARFDLAIDIPVPREKCFLVKDRRLYIERRHGQEFTQYLGAKSSAVGRVKLYNKSIESDLDYPLTRLELTLDPETPFEGQNFPTVYFLSTSSLGNDKVRVTNTERFILQALLNGYGTLGDLGRKTRKKIEGLITDYIDFVVIPSEVYDAILEQVQAYKSGAICN